VARRRLRRKEDSARLIHRFELIAVGVLSAVLTVAGLVLAGQLNAVDVPLECFGDADVHGPTGSAARACVHPLLAFNASADMANRLFAALAVFPALAGLFLGAPAVSRELEHGTAVLPRTLSGRRRRWLLRRALVLGGLLVFILAPLAVVGDILESARSPLVSPSVSFSFDGLRGAVLVARGLAAFSVALVRGLIVGRQLPAIFIGLVAAGILLVGDITVSDAWSHQVAAYVTPAKAHLGDRSIVAALRGRADGKIVSQADIVT
jgi:hypothetical protein